MFQISNTITATCECGAVYTCDTAGRLFFKISTEVGGCPHQPRKIDKLSAQGAGKAEKMASVKRARTRAVLERIHALYSARGIQPRRDERNLEMEIKISEIIGTAKYTSIWYWKNKYIKALQNNEF